MRQLVIAVTAALCVAAPTGAAAQARGFIPPDCDLNKGHYLVNSANLYLQNAARTRFQDQRERDLKDARRVLLQAIDQGQDQNGAVWYFLGRYYAEMNDLDGVDSSFTRAASLIPQCGADINTHRRRLWVPLLNAGVDAIRSGDTETAMARLRRANQIFGGEPPGFYYLGQLYAGRQERDSAVTYFRRALAVASDGANRENAQYAEVRRDAVFNLALLYQRAQLYDSAIVWFRRYRTMQPNDQQALTGMAATLEEAGREAEALALYDSVLMRADSMPPLNLFEAGVAMFRAKRYQRAAEAFSSGLQRNPHYRDALFNLANTYLSLANTIDTTLPKAQQATLRKEYGEKMGPVLAQLLAVDPQNNSVRRLLAASYQLRDLSDSTLAVLERIEAMPFDVTVSQFQRLARGYDVRGLLTNMKAAETAVPALTFEFLNAQGETVETIAVDGRTLEPEGLAPFAMAPTAEGIVAWRYRVGT